MTIRDVIERHGHFAHGGNPDDTAETWAESGFEAPEVDEWLLARCFDPARRGTSPTPASPRRWRG
jgi:hypothetical protein